MNFNLPIIPIPKPKLITIFALAVLVLGSSACAQFNFKLKHQTLKHTNPTLTFVDTTAGEKNWQISVDNNQFSLLFDADGDGIFDEDPNLTWDGTDLDLDADTGAFPDFKMSAYSAVPNIWVRRAEGTKASPTKVTTGLTVGNILGGGYNAGWANAGAISFIADGEWGTASDVSDSPTRIAFSVVADGSGTNVVKMTLDSDGGLFMDGATGGSQGSGTINASAFYDDGVLLGAGYGDVTKVGTPVNNQIGVWTGDGTLEGDDNFTFDGTDLDLDADTGAFPDFRMSAYAAVPNIWVRRAQGTKASPTKVTTGLTVGNILGGGYNAGWANAGAISFIADGEWGTASDVSDSPTLIAFSVVADGSGTNVVKMTLDSDGGLFMDGATGGSQGSGTINASAFYDDGVLLTGGGGGTPGGSDREIQFNDSGAFGGDPDFTWSGTDLEIQSFSVGNFNRDALIIGVENNIISTTPGGAGLKASILFQLENSVFDTMHDAGKLSFEWTDATSTSEDSQFKISTYTAGAIDELIVLDSTTFTYQGNEVLTGATGGDVTKVGTPVNNEIGVWTGNGTIEGDANFTWSGATLAITGGMTVSSSTIFNGPVTIQGSSATSNIDFLMADNQDLLFGTGSDWGINYNEVVDDQLLIHTTKNGALTATDPMLQILVGGATTGNQQVFGVAKGTQGSNTDLMTLDSEGDVVFGGDITGGNVTSGDDPGHNHTNYLNSGGDAISGTFQLNDDLGDSPDIQFITGSEFWFIIQAEDDPGRNLKVRTNTAFVERVELDNQGSGQLDLRLTDGNIQLSAAGATVDNVDLDFVMQSTGGTFTGDIELNDSTGDSPRLRFHPQTGTVWDISVIDADDDLEIEVMSSATEQVRLRNSSTGQVDLNLEDGNIILSAAGATVDGVDLTDHVGDASAHHAKTAIDDTPADADITDGISSNWAFDHKADASAHHAVTVDTDTHATVSKNSTADLTERQTINFIEGSNVTLTIADDAAGDEIDVTIAATDTDTDTFVTGKDAHDHLGGDGATILHSSLGGVGASDHHTATVDTDTFVTGKDAHDHLGGDGAQILHSSLGSVGANDHHTPTVDTNTQLSNAQVETAYNAQVGAMSQATAEAGTSTTIERVTAQRIKQAILALSTESFIVAISDETTAITTGTAKVTFRMPYAFTVTEVRASVNTASTSGLPTFDINESGVSILSTVLTIDANEETSETAVTAPVISDSALADDAEITIDIDVAGTGAKGAKITIIGHQ